MHWLWWAFMGELGLVVVGAVFRCGTLQVIGCACRLAPWHVVIGIKVCWLGGGEGNRAGKRDPRPMRRTSCTLKHGPTPYLAKLNSLTGELTDQAPVRHHADDRLWASGQP